MSKNNTENPVEVELVEKTDDVKKTNELKSRKKSNTPMIMLAAGAAVVAGVGGFLGGMVVGKASNLSKTDSQIGGFQRMNSGRAPETPRSEGANTQSSETPPNNERSPSTEGERPSRPKRAENINTPSTPRDNSQSNATPSNPTEQTSTKSRN